MEALVRRTVNGDYEIYVERQIKCPCCGGILKTLDVKVLATYTEEEYNKEIKQHVIEF